MRLHRLWHCDGIRQGGRESGDHGAQRARSCRTRRTSWRICTACACCRCRRTFRRARTTRPIVQNVVRTRRWRPSAAFEVLINNAQASASGVPLAEHTTEQLDLTRLFRPVRRRFYYMKACYPYLAQSHGSVINFASGAGLFGKRGPVRLRRRQGGHSRPDARGGHRVGQGRHQRQYRLPPGVDGAAGEIRRRRIPKPLRPM